MTVRCENYWFRLPRGSKFSRDKMKKVQCKNTASTLFTPKFPYKPEPKWARPRWLCNNCVKDAELQDWIQERVQNGTLFND